MSAWREDGLMGHRRRQEVLAAVSAHDDGWDEPDREPIWSAEGPLDFVTAPIDIRLGVWPRGIARVRERHGAFPAALVAHHPLALFRRYGTPSEAAGLVGRLRTWIDELIREDETATPEEVRAAYRFVELGDLLSLVFCDGRPGERLLQGVRIRLHQKRLVVSPDPFDGNEVPLSVPARRVPRRRYASAAALAEVWGRAEPFHLEGIAAGA